MEKIEMPPQPVSSVRSNAQIVIDPVALRKHENLATRVAYIVAIWARIEANLGTTLARMLRGQARPAIAMYSAILNAQTKMVVLEAAARVTLEPEDLRVFGALIILVKRAGAKRHKLAHWLWGESQEIPNALILVDPEEMREGDKAVSDIIGGLEKGTVPISFRTLDLAKAFVYRDKELDEIIGEINDVEALTLTLASSVGFVGTLLSKTALRDQLLASPRIQEVLRQQEKPNPGAVE